ncbi:MAG: chloride channel protein [Chitinophagaceae bacterium]|nr:chloride channel protein [Chitinophagaceae bacterium]
MSVQQTPTPNNNYSFFQRLLKWIVLCVLIGFCSGSAAALFLYTLDLVTEFRENHVWIVAFLPIAGFMVGCCYHRFGKETEAGNKLLLATIQQPTQKIIPWIMAPLIYVGTLITHLFGGSAGREGTALQMSGAMADQLSKPFGLNAEDRRTLLIASIAAGFGAVFGTPLAGFIFALEINRKIALRYTILVPVLAASILADLVTRLWGIPHTTYAIELIPAFSWLTISYTIMAGAVFGVCAFLFVQIMHVATQQYKNRISYPPLRPFIGGMIVVLLFWWIGNSKYMGLGIPVIIESFHEPMEVYDFALKMILTILTLSAGFKGGEVTPLFFIGALLGNALSVWIPLPVSMLTGLGFVAVFAGATHAPLACMVMAMELFGKEVFSYAVIVCIMAFLLSGKKSIYQE